MECVVKSKVNILLLKIKHDSVSKKHAAIIFDEQGKARLKDLQSTNGTFLNEEQLLKGGDLEINNNSVITLGKG